MEEALKHEQLAHSIQSSMLSTGIHVGVQGSEQQQQWRGLSFQCVLVQDWNFPDG